MSSIIQDFAKIINSRISKTLLVYLGLVFCLGSGFVIGRTSKIIESVPEVTIENVDGTYYQNPADFSNETNNINSDTFIKNNFNSNSQSNNQNNLTTKDSLDKSQIFASRKGKYFYYKGCGGGTISKKNLVYYKSEQEAISAGKIIYSKCK